MILEIKKTTEIKLDSLEDLQEYKKSMDDNNLKINIASLSRKYKVDRRTINKYLNDFLKKKTKNKTSKLDKYYELIKSLLSSSTQTFSYIRVLRQYKESLAVLDQTLEQVNKNNLTFIDGFLYFTQAQVEKKKQNLIQHSVKVAGFPSVKTLSEFDFDFQESINKQQIYDFNSLRFIDKKENIIVVLEKHT